MSQQHLSGISECRFGVFEVHFAAGELRKRGVRIKLQEQPFRILALLLRNPGEVVSRETIRNTLWPADTFVDFEQSTSAAVAKLRAALGDSAENPRFVETIARHGYRFIAPVSPLTHEEPVLPGPQLPQPLLPDAQEQPAKPRRVRRRFLRLAGGLAAVAVALGTFFWMTRTARPTSQPELKPLPFTSYPGTESGPSFSPDGTRVAFSWDGPRQDNLDIYVKLIGAGDPVRLTEDPSNDHDPAWSPDGSWIAFLRDINDTERAILLIPALGGAERTVARTSLITSSTNLTDSPLLSWAVDGKSLFTLDTQGMNAHSYSVVRVSVDTGEKQQVTFPPPRVARGDLAVAVSPDGNTLAFTRRVTPSTTDLFRMRLPQSVPELVLSGARMEGIAWTPDGRNLVFSGELGGSTGLWRIGISGTGKPTKLIGIAENSIRLKRTGRGRGVNLAVAQKGRRLVFSQGTFDINIWRIGLRDGDKGAKARFLSSTRDEFQPDYSPDGQRIAFESDRSGCEEIWASNSSGSTPFQVTNFGSGWSGSPRWSPDGRRIAFDRLAGERWAIFIVDSQGGRPIRLTTDPVNNSTPSWSRDGRWIYFISDRSGSIQIWKIPSTGGPGIQVNTNGGRVPVESLDGKELYYSRSSGPRNITLWKRPASGGEEAAVVEHLLFPNAYAVATNGIYFIEGASTSSAPFGDSSSSALPLRFLNVRNGLISTVGSVQGSNLAGRLAVSPDETWVLYGHDDGNGSDLLLLENFR